MEIDNSTFRKITRIVYDNVGIVLNDSKKALVTARVRTRMKSLEIDQFRDYYDFLDSDTSGDELVQLLDVISTNVTHFFRESEHFDVLSDATSGWVAQGQKKFRFWSAACSTGQEPYAMAMKLSEIKGIDATDLKILATDISTQVLSHSKQGVYNEKNLKTVPAKLRNRYFTRRQNGVANFEVKAPIKELITFKRLNLAKPPFPMKGPFDFVFCCNVMIYFDNKVRSGLVNEFYRLLKPGGYLIVGTAESLTGLNTKFTTVSPSVYIKEEF
ncbi:MAG: CheR family methyltransferase [Candidatus Marinimicrobia bacterium]|nr:CheR family methyltransferase [Candidatus Neomarinimicrobiota bacterium]